MRTSWIWLAVAGVVAVGVLAVVAPRFRKLPEAASVADAAASVASPVADEPSPTAVVDEPFPPVEPKRGAVRPDERLESECDAGKADACWSLGYAAQERQEREAAYDAYRRAVLLYDKACDQKDMQACEKMSYAYRDGKGVTRDPRRAEEYAEKLFGGPRVHEPSMQPRQPSRTQRPQPTAPQRQPRPLDEFLR